jgi:hypothetical protein
MKTVANTYGAPFISKCRFLEYLFYKEQWHIGMKWARVATGPPDSTYFWHTVTFVLGPVSRR